MPWSVDTPPREPEAPAAPLPPPAEGAPPPPPPAPPPRSSAAGFFAAVITLYGLLGVIAQASSPLWGLAWSELATLLLPALVAASGTNARIGPALGLRRAPDRLLALAALVGAAGFLGGGALMALSSLALPPRWLQAFDLTPLFDRPPLERAGLALLAAVLAPVCEEATFRGWLLTTLRTRLPTGAAIVVSAVLFAATHLDPVRFLALVALACVFGWLAWRAGSLWPAIIAHGVNNALGVVAVAAGGTAGAARAAGASAREVAASAAFTLALSGAGLASLLSLYRRWTPAPPAAGELLLRRDPADVAPGFRFARVSPQLLAAAALALATLGLLLALGSRPAA